MLDEAAKPGPDATSALVHAVLAAQVIVAYDNGERARMRSVGDEARGSSLSGVANVPW